MTSKSQILHDQLENCIEDLLSQYRSLLELIKQEKQGLLVLDMNILPGINESKEKLVLKIQSIETSRLKIAESLFRELGLNSETPRLSALADQKLRAQGTALQGLVQKVKELNLQNRELVVAGLQHVSGAMGHIREQVQEKPTYHKDGQKQSPAVAAGHLVRREV